MTDEEVRLIGSLPKSANEKDVVTFLENFGLTSQPVYVDYQDEGYEPDFCHVSAKHVAQSRGGRRIHGWAIWQFEGLVIAEFHSVWETPDGKLIDVTKPKWNESKVLFVHDPSLGIAPSGNGQVLYCDRTSWKEIPYMLQGYPSDPTWTIPSDNPHLVRYCEKLKLSNTSMA